MTTTTPTLGRVLVVDDNIEICDVIQSLLQSSNYEARACFSADEAYELLDDYAPDVVLLDLNMPEIDGLDGIMLFRRYTKHPERPIIIVSALPKHEMESKTKDMGAYAYIQKPFDTKHLLNTIANAKRAHPIVI